MSLRLKSLLIFSGTLLVLFGIVLGLVNMIINGQFDNIEIEMMRRGTQHLRVELQEDIDPLAATIGDWAPWDELYYFATGRDPSFPEFNMSEKVLETLRIHFLSIWSQDGELLELCIVPLQLAMNGISREELIAAIRQERIVPQRNVDTPVAGLMLVDKKAAMVAAQAIVRSDRTGPVGGTLVGGIILGAKEIRKINEFNDDQLTFAIREDGHSHGAASRPPPPIESDVRIVDEDTIAGSIPLVDICGENIGTAELVGRRELHAQANATVRIFLIALASSAGILLFVVWYVLDANVIFPVRWLAAKLAGAAAEGDLPSNLSLKSGGELAHLAGRIEDLARTVAFAEANYRAIVEDQTDFIFRHLPDGRITFVNKALCTYFERSRESFLNSSVSSLVAEEDSHRVAKSIRGLSAKMPLATFDHRVRLPNGETAWFRRTVRAIFSGDGELRELQSVARDVTQAHLSLQKIEASETRYRRLFETASDGILIVRQSSGIAAEANPKLCDLLNMPRSAIIGRPVESLPPFKAKSVRLLKRMVEGDLSIRGTEIILPTKSGDQRYNEVTAGFYDEGGERVVQLNFRDITLRKRANDELRQLSGQLMRTQDAERRRIARELHDSTAQNLSAVQMSLTQIDGVLPANEVKARVALQEIRTLTDLSLNEIRTISYLLHPPLLDEVGLLFALQWYVDGFMSRTEKIVRLETPDTLQRLPREIETTVFRIVQEGLTNVHRHSGARRAWIRLALADGVLTLEIRDDGRGMPAPLTSSQVSGSPVPGVGMAGMRERLRQFQGTFSVESDRNGTIIRATLPLDLHESP